MGRKLGVEELECQRRPRECKADETDSWRRLRESGGLEVKGMGVQGPDGAVREI